VPYSPLLGLPLVSWLPPAHQQPLRIIPARICLLTSQHQHQYQPAFLPLPSPQCHSYPLARAHPALRAPRTIAVSFSCSPRHWCALPSANRSHSTGKVTTAGHPDPITPAPFPPILVHEDDHRISILHQRLLRALTTTSTSPCSALHPFRHMGRSLIMGPWILWTTRKIQSYVV
jgi:hypothetical protein